MWTRRTPGLRSIIDAGSSDDSYERALALERSDAGVHAFRLSRNYTSHYAIFAGLSICKGSCATVIPDDEQQPYETIIAMYRLWEKGEKIIIPHRLRRSDPFFSKLLAVLYYRTMNAISPIRFPPGGFDTFFIDRELIDLVNTRIHPINTSVSVELLRLGFNPSFIPYERNRSVATKSRWTLQKRLKLAADTIFSSSSFPIKLIMAGGFALSIGSVCLIVFYGYIRLFGNPAFWGQLPAGWTEIILLLSLFSGVILFSLGIIAEYLWRIYEEVKNRPGYIICEKQNELDNNSFPLK